MRNSIILIAICGFLSTTIALPAMESRQTTTTLCSGSNSAQCCDVNVLGIADLDCETPPTVPTNITDFNNICASVGKINMCCLLPLLDQGIICTTPDGS